MKGANVFGILVIATIFSAGCSTTKGHVMDSGALGQRLDDLRSSLVPSVHEGDAAPFFSSIPDLRECTILHFWETWCAHCVVELPALENFSRSNKDKDVVVFGVFSGVLSSEEKWQRLITKYSLSFFQWRDLRATLFNAFGVKVVPTTFAINKKGIVSFVGVGMIDWEHKNPCDVKFQSEEGK